MKAKKFHTSFFILQASTFIISYTNSINDCNTFLDKDAIYRVSTNGLFVAFFFQIGIMVSSLQLNLGKQLVWGKDF